MRIGILALQGAFAEHEMMLQKIGAETFEIRQLKDIERPFDRLVIPGCASYYATQDCSTHFAQPYCRACLFLALAQA